MRDRLQALKEKLHLEWGELADRLEISRSMIDQMRGGSRSAGPKLERRIVDLEIQAGIVEAPTPYTQGTMVCESPAPYNAQRPASVEDPKTNQIMAELRALTDQIKLLTHTMNLMMERPKPKE